MANLSDIIEEFILLHLESGSIELQRNELADYFSCAPSQINYVISTRFTPQRGYLIESRRGGGGFIKVVKTNIEEDGYINNLITTVIGQELSQTDMQSILAELEKLEVISQRENHIITCACSNKSLNSPLKIQDRQRATIIKNILLDLYRED